jgi:MFS family permease
MYNSDNKKNGSPFLRFFMSRNLVRLSSIMFYIYYMWVLMVKYDSVFLVSLIPTLSLTGYLMVLIPEGYILDRFPRQWVMFLSSVAIVSVYLSLLISQALIWIYLAAMFSSVFSSISSDAFFTLMKDIMKPSAMGRGMSLVEVGRGMSEVIGIILGGMSIIFLSRWFVPFIVFTGTVSVALSLPRTAKNRNRAQNKYGFYHVFRAIRVMLPFLIIGLLINGLFISLEVYASGLFYQILHEGPSYYTAFILGFSSGGLAGGLLGIRISRKLENPAFIAFSMAFFGLSFFLLSISRIPDADVLITVALGLVNSLTNIPLMAYLVKIIPNEAMGRVNSIVTLFLASSSPVMAAAYGGIAQFLPIPTVLLLISVLLAISSVPTYISIKKLFKLTESKIKEIMDQNSTG